jgi:hypothetical protein
MEGIKMKKVDYAEITTSCYSLDPTGINAAYKEQEYRQKADDYRMLQSIIVMNQEVKNGLKNVETRTCRIHSVISSLLSC